MESLKHAGYADSTSIEIKWINSEECVDYANCKKLLSDVDAVVVPGGFGVRVDSHVYQDYTIPPYYDSMIGKLICWGRTRNEARRRMYRALKEYVVTGVETTIPFHQAIIEDEVFMSGKFNTGFIEDFYKRKGLSEE